MRVSPGYVQYTLLALLRALPANLSSQRKGRGRRQPPTMRSDRVQESDVLPTMEEMGMMMGILLIIIAGVGQWDISRCTNDRSMVQHDRPGHIACP